MPPGGTTGFTATGMIEIGRGTGLGWVDYALQSACRKSEFDSAFLRDVSTSSTIFKRFIFKLIVGIEMNVGRVAPPFLSTFFVLLLGGG